MSSTVVTIYHSHFMDEKTENSVSPSCYQMKRQSFKNADLKIYTCFGSLEWVSSWKWRQGWRVKKASYHYKWPNSVPFYGWVIMYMYHDFFIHSFIHWWTSRFFLVLAIVNNAAWTLGYMCLLELWFSLGISPVVGFLAHMVVLFLVFKEISILFSIMAVLIYILSSARGFLFLHILSSIYCL